MRCHPSAMVARAQLDDWTGACDVRGMFARTPTTGAVPLPIVPPGECSPGARAGMEHMHRGAGVQKILCKCMSRSATPIENGEAECVVR